MLELEVVKEHCRIEPDFTDDDSLLTLYIGAASRYVETWTRRKMYESETSEGYADDPDSILPGDDVKAAMSGKLAPEHRETILGVAEVREVFHSSKFGAAAGCMVLEGVLHRNKPIRILRDDVVVFQGELESLRRYKDVVEEVRAGMECGLAVKGYKDIKVKDKIEVYDVQLIKRSL